ncbi:unnamed protein product [Eretmochelys imbricata]
MSLKEARKLEMVLTKCMRRRMEGGVSTLSSVALMCGYISPNAHRIWMFAICPFKPMLDLPHLFCFIPESTAVNKLHQPHQSNLQKRSGVNSCVSSLSSLPHSMNKPRHGKVE